MTPAPATSSHTRPLSSLSTAGNPGLDVSAYAIYQLTVNTPRRHNARKMREANGSHSNSGNHGIFHLLSPASADPPPPSFRSCKPETEDGPGTASPATPAPECACVLAPHSQRPLYSLFLVAPAPCCSPPRFVWGGGPLPSPPPSLGSQRAFVHLIYNDDF